MSNLKKNPSREVVIRISSEQVLKANEWLSEINSSHLKEECLPPGFEVVIMVSPWEQNLGIRCDRKEIDLGEVEMSPLPGWCL